MVYQLVISVLLIIYFFSFGLLFKRILPQINNFFSLTILNGMIGVGLLGYVIAFVLPLDYFYEISLIVISIVGVFLFKKHFKDFGKFCKTIPWHFYFVLLCGLVFTVTYPYILDHFGYYIPTIKWLDYAGYVKGLSNLEWVLVQNSFWHVLQASINETLDPFYRLNYLLFIVFNLYVIESKSNRLLVFNFLYLFFLNTPSPDLPVLVLSIIILNEYFNNPSQVSKYLFLSTIVFIIKPISILLLFFFLIEFFRRKDYKILKDRNLFYISVLAIVFCLKGIILSANPLFPLSFTSINNLSWASPQSLYNVSQATGRFIPLKELFTYDEVQKMGQIDYLKNVFFGDIFRSRILLFIVIFSISVFLLSLINFKKNKLIVILSLSLLVKIMYITITSPQFRFLLDVFIIDVFILLTLIKRNIFKTKWILVNLSVMSLMSLLILLPNFWSKYITGISTLGYITKFDSSFLIKPGQYENLEFKSDKIGNFKYNYPINYPLIYSVKVPAASVVTLNWYYLNNGFTQQIDASDVKKGFYWKTLNNADKKYIENILKEEQKKQVK